LSHSDSGSHRQGEERVVQEPRRGESDAAEPRTPEDYEQQYAEAMEANDDLVERLRHGDVHALASLIQAVTGVKVTSSRTIEPSQ
jgi:hypothetical protein